MRRLILFVAVTLLVSTFAYAEVQLKFVKGAHLKTWNTEKPVEQSDRHVVQVDQILRIKSKNKPPVSDLPEFDLKPSVLASVKKVRISGPSLAGGISVRCINDVTTPNRQLSALLRDHPVTSEDSLVSIEITGGKFSYPHSRVALPNHPEISKTMGWIQVDFEQGPITVDLFSDAGTSLGSYTIYDGQAFDIASFIMYEKETNALDDEKVLLTKEQAAVLGKTFPVFKLPKKTAEKSDKQSIPEYTHYIFFKVLETGDGTSGNGH